MNVNYNDFMDALDELVDNFNAEAGENSTMFKFEVLRDRINGGHGIFVKVYSAGYCSLEDLVELRSMIELAEQLLNAFPYPLTGVKFSNDWNRI